MKTLIGSALIFGMVGAASAAVNCNTFPNNTITGSVNDDVIAVGYSCTIARTGFVNGNVTQTGAGRINVSGRVNGGVEEFGGGNVVVDGGVVEGDITEADAGSLIVRNGGSVNGLLSEAGGGDVNVTVTNGGVVKGDIVEAGLGNVYVATVTGNYEGSVVENDDGSIELTVGGGTAFKGGAEETGSGSLDAFIEGLLEGNLTELGAGDLLTEGPGTFKGNSEHQLPGTCTNSILDFQGAFCNLL